MDIELKQNKHWQAFRAAFEQQHFFDCHEYLEMIWLKAEGSQKLYLQALIQLCVALFHWQNHNLKGAISLIKKSQNKANYLSFPP